MARTPQPWRDEMGRNASPKWASMLDPEVAAFLHREAKVMEWYQEKIPAVLAEVVENPLPKDRGRIDLGLIGRQRQLELDDASDGDDQRLRPERDDTAPANRSGNAERRRLDRHAPIVASFHDVTTAP